MQGSDVKRRVLIGSQQSCSCGGGTEEADLCTHILFVLIKVLRVPRAAEDADGAREKADALYDEALEALEGFGDSAWALRELAGFIVTRRS